MATNIYTIPAGAAFAELLARGVVDLVGSDPMAIADTTVLVPTRRAVRSLQESFAQTLGGAALLPVIRPLGDVDDEDLLFDPQTDDFSLPRVIDPVRRRLLLTALVGRWKTAKDGASAGRNFLENTNLARALAQFIDEAETQGADLSQLDGLAEGNLAQHWQHVRDFLAFIRAHWPGVMAAERATNPAERRNVALGMLAEKFRNDPPSAPVIAAGTTGSIPATASLLKDIAALPNGAIVLPGLDRELDGESWSRLDEGHAQYGMKQLLEYIGVDRETVRDWPGAVANPARAELLRETLRPAPTTDAWRALSENGDAGIAQGLDDLFLIEAAHPAEEAAAIALVLRHALETKKATAALVTPDRNLARRVSAELKRWNIAIDDSAGRPLANTPAGAFLCLLADAARENFAPVQLLALLKHPLAAGGREPGEFRRQVRALDRFVLRGPRPDPGLEGVAKAIAANASGLRDWFGEVAILLEPLAAGFARPTMPLDELAHIHAVCGESLARTPARKGGSRLWSGQDGEAAAGFLNALQSAGTDLPPIDTASYPYLFRALAEERAVRPAYGTHPRLAILGPLEARLQYFDIVVLGGLNEGTWPQSPPADPWLSRPMRKALGFESPERRIGLAAHDFATLASAPRVFLTRALKSEGTPTVASRWIERLKQLTSGLGLSAKLACTEPYAAYASMLDLPHRTARPEPQPRPAPDVSLRPRRLSVTEIETWLRDPYAIYAKHILALRPLDALDAEIGHLERGSAIHLILEHFVRERGSTQRDPLSLLLEIGDRVFAEMAIPRAVLAIWRPRFARAAAWFLDAELGRNADIEQSFVEIEGQRSFAGPAGPFVLRCRADRIDVLRDGRAVILDYKTGSPPSEKQVQALLAPQLPLEGAILQAGGFETVGPRETAELAYVRIAGGAKAGEFRSIKGNMPALVDLAAAHLTARIAQFDDGTTPYMAHLVPFSTKIPGDYDHLARVREWSLSGWQDDFNEP